jgi:tetratricopeptide (TPR) repeat protein
LAPIEPQESLDATLTAADALALPVDRPKARGLYLAVLAENPDDFEAAVGLAQVDAWDECFALAEAGYRAVLARSPRNVDARAGLADVLLKLGRWAEAGRVLDDGLQRDPYALELLTRRARAAHWTSDPATALHHLTRAERISPVDPEIRAARDRVFLGQARLSQRLSIMPTGYDDVYVTDLAAMQRWRQWRIEMSTSVVSRYGASRPTRSGAQQTRVLDGRPSFGLFYHFTSGAWFGGSAAVSAPALALPRYALNANAFTPLHGRFALTTSASYWRYEDQREVAILSPALAVTLTDAVDLVGSYWLTAVIVHSSAAPSFIEYVHSAGLRVNYRPSSILSVGLDYTYGVQLERQPSASDFLELRSHVMTVLGRRLVSRTFGVDAAISLERRAAGSGRAPGVWGWAVEPGLFLRW